MSILALLVILGSMAPDSKEISFRVGSTRFLASLSSVGDSGLFWVRPEGAGGGRDFVQIIDDPSFEGLRLQSFPIKGHPEARVVFTEYYRSNWMYPRFFLVRGEKISEVLGFSHRDQDALQLIKDRAGNLVEVRFDDRWIGAGLRPVGLRSDPAPGKRWCLTSKFKPSMDKTWKAYSSKWHAIPAP